MTDKDAEKTVDLAPRLTAGGFDRLYREGMSLIEEVAAYLDGTGRNDSRSLPREASFVYATESMRLTTRLMQIASWLLLQRAMNEGELSPESARSEKEKVKFSATPMDRGGPGWEELPPALLDYIAKGDEMFERVQRFDRLERGDAPSPVENNPEDGLAAQMSRLQAAFGQTRD